MEITLKEVQESNLTLDDLTEVYYLACLASIQNDLGKEKEESLNRICDFINEMKDFNLGVKEIVDDHTFHA